MNERNLRGLIDRVRPGRLSRRSFLRRMAAVGLALLQVHAGAEVAPRSGQDADPDIGIVVDAVPGFDHDREHFAGEGVAGFWTIHRHDEGVSALFDEGVAHG